MFNKFKKNEKGAADVVALMFGIIILLSLMISALDAAMYFMTRSQVQAGARDGARTVAIFGGAGTAGEVTELQKAYGNMGACDTVVPTGESPNPTNGKEVECEVYNQLNSREGLMNGNIVNVTCGPEITTSIGTPTWCDVTWKYKSLPGSPITIFSTSSPTDTSTLGNTPLQLASQNHSRASSVFEGNKVVTGTSQSEVKLSTSDLVPRY